MGSYSQFGNLLSHQLSSLWDFPSMLLFPRACFLTPLTREMVFFSELYVLVPPWQCNFIGRDGLRASIREKKKISPFLIHCLEIGVSLGVSANCYTPCGISQFSPLLGQSWGKNKVNSPLYRLLFFKL